MREDPDVHQQEHIGDIAEVKHVVVPPAARRVPISSLAHLPMLQAWADDVRLLTAGLSAMLHPLPG